MASVNWRLWCAVTGCFLLELSLAASVTVGPFEAVAGTYFGLFGQTDPFTQASAGSLTLTITPQGKLSARLQTGTGRYSLSGQFDTSGNFTKAIARPRLSPLNITLTLDLAGGTDRVTGSVSDGVWMAQLAGDRAVFDGRRNVAPQAGLYTMIIPGDCSAADAPCGDGYGTLSVSGKGGVRLSAVLADGTKLTQAAGVSATGQWPLYAPLYGGHGSVWSWLTFTNPPSGDLGGALEWLKPPVDGAKYYPAGFAVSAIARGSSYIPAGSGMHVLSLTNASLVLSGGDFATNLAIAGALSPDNKVKLANKSSLSFSLGNGSFRGTAFNPANSKPVRFGGVVLQQQGIGCGSFLGQSRSGRVRFSAATDAGYVVQFQTFGRAFAPVADADSASLETYYWTWSDGTVSFDYPNTTKQFGSPQTRQQYLTVYPPDALVALNIGFDESDGGFDTPLPKLPPQNVGAVYFPAPLTSLKYWASSYNPITNTLDFTGFTSLQNIECFECTNLQRVVVANLPALRRVCFEECGLQELDLSGNPNLEDARAALNAFTNIVVGAGTGPKVWHWCTRSNPQLTQHFQDILTNFFSLQDLWVASDNQSGAVTVVSTNLTDVWADDNFYACADFSGQPNLTFCRIHNNSLTNLVLSACPALRVLDARQNQLTTPVLDALLALVDTTTTNLTSVDLSQNAERPSSAGYLHYTNLVTRGVKVTVDF